jgi:hypothetical protein
MMWRFFHLIFPTILLLHPNSLQLLRVLITEDVCMPQVPDDLPTVPQQVPLAGRFGRHWYCGPRRIQPREQKALRIAVIYCVFSPKFPFLEKPAFMAFLYF